MDGHLDLHAPEPFKVIGQTKSWEQYLKRFEYYLKATGVSKDEQKRAMLLHISGYEVQDIFETLPDPGTKYDQAINALNNYFEPKKHIQFERHMFRKSKQETSETIDDFIVRISKLAIACDFRPDQKEDMIRDQIVDGCKSTELRRKLLAAQDLTLEKVQRLGRTYELAVTHSEKMENGDHSEQRTQDPEINKLRQKPKQFKPRGAPKSFQAGNQNGKKFSRSTAHCYRCGRTGHYGKDCRISRDIKCHKCGNTGHFAKMCKSKSTKNVHAIEEEDSDVEIFTLDGKDSAVIPLTIEGKLINVLIDSGASINAIDRKTFDKLKTSKTQIENCTINVFPYGSKSPLQMFGKTKLSVTVQDKQHEIEFHIIKGDGKPLIGHKTAIELGLLHIGTIHSVNTVANQNTDTIISSFKDRFEGLGKLKDFQLKLHIDKTVKPVAQPVRKIPFKMRKQVEAKIEELEKSDVIEKVEGPTPWVSGLVVVPKANSNEVRLCIDMRQANKAVLRERFPIPNIEDVLQQMNGSSLFSRLDLKQSFHQLELDENSRYITTFVCHKGLYRYKRLMFGINSAPELHQRVIEQTIQDIPGCKNIADDIIVYAKTQLEHDQTLRALLTRLREKNLTLNRDKCEFNKTQLKFMGHVLSKDGVQPDLNKIKAVRDFETPKNPTSVKSFLGLVNFCAKYIPNFATIAEPLRKLTRKDVEWEWTLEQQNAFEKLKQSLTSADVMSYYNPNAETNVVVDASPFGVGSILMQKQSNGDFRPVAYASRTLSPVERRYSQTEREALGVYWGIRRFNVYLYGKDFTVYTDHKPLERIYTAAHEAPPRIQKWVLNLQNHNFTVKYRPGHLNAADILSRSPSKDCETDTDAETEEYVYYVANNACPRAMNLDEIESASARDDILKQVRNCIEKNNWSRQGQMKPFFLIRKELTVQNSVVLKGTKIVIPSELRNRVLRLSHETHQGVVKTKQLLREKVWWPSMDSDVESMIQNCHACQLLCNPPRPPTVEMTELPDGPWKKCAIDLSGPYANNEYLLVLIDYFSRFPEVEIIRSITSATIINKLRKIFSIHGLCTELVSDNGSQFVSDEFKTFLSDNGIKHTRVTPYWPRANGLVENFNKNLKKTIRAATVEGKNWHVELYNFLLQYRATPHTTTGCPPATLLFNRTVRTKLPCVIKDNVPREVKERDTENKAKEKYYADKTKDENFKRLCVGQKVIVKLRDGNKLSTKFENNVYRVVRQTGTSVLVRSDNGQTFYRNISHVRPYHGGLINRQNRNDDRLVNVRPHRIRKQPARFNDFILTD